MKSNACLFLIFLMHNVCYALDANMGNVINTIEMLHIKQTCCSPNLLKCPQMLQVLLSYSPEVVSVSLTFSII